MIKYFMAVLLMASGWVNANEACDSKSIKGDWMFSFDGKSKFQCKIAFNEDGTLNEKLCTQLPFSDIKSTEVTPADKVEVIMQLDGCAIKGDLQLFKKISAGESAGSVSDLKLSKPFIIHFDGLIGSSDNIALGSFLKGYKEKINKNGIRQVDFSDGGSFTAIKTKEYLD